MRQLRFRGGLRLRLEYLVDAYRSDNCPPSTDISVYLFIFVGIYFYGISLGKVLSVVSWQFEGSERGLYTKDWREDVLVALHL